MLRKLFILTLIMIFFMSSNYASDLSDMTADFEDYISVGFIVIIIHLTLVALTYMYANFFMSEELKVWSKNEVMQAVYSMIILGSFLVLFVMINSFAGYFFTDIINSSIEGIEGESSINSFCFDTGTNRWISDESKCNSEKHQVVETLSTGGVVCKDGKGKTLDGCNPMFLMARSYLGITYEKLAKLHKVLLRNYSLMNAMNSMGNYMSFGKGSGALEWGASVSLLFRTDGIYIALLESLILFVEKILLMLKFQESILKFAEFGLAFYLIVLGLIFRSIFVFRKFGGLLLSLGMCFMFVLPLLYIIGWYTLSIPNIDIVMTEDFSDAYDKSDASWPAMTYYISIISYAIVRVLEAIQPTPITPAAMPMAIFKTVVDLFVVVSQIIMTVQYQMNVVANNMDFYFTDYSVAGETYALEGIQNMGVLDYISRFLIIALAVPLLNIYMFFAFVRGLSPLLGGDAEIPALGRFL